MNNTLNNFIGLISSLMFFIALGIIAWIVVGAYWERYRLTLVLSTIILEITWWLMMYANHNYQRYKAEERWVWTLPSFSKFCVMIVIFYIVSRGLIGPPWRGFELYYILVISFLATAFVFAMGQYIPIEKAEGKMDTENSSENKPESRD